MNEPAGACINTSIIVNDLNGRVFSYNAAVGNANIQVMMALNAHAGLSSVSSNGTYPVLMRRLPEIFPDRTQKIKLLKIDIEVGCFWPEILLPNGKLIYFQIPSSKQGFENEVFQSLTEMIEADQIENIIVEIKIGINTIPKIDFINKMIGRGFKIYQYPERYDRPISAYGRRLNGRTQFLTITSPNRFNNDINMCIEEVKQIVNPMALHLASGQFFQWEDFLITKKRIPSAWRVTKLNGQ